MSWVLMLDDLRNFETVKIPDIYDCFEKVLVKTYDEFILILDHKGLPTAIFMDHDLSTEHYIYADKSIIPYEKFKQKTGLSATKYLIEYCQKNNKNLPKFYCHSMNPVV